MFFNYFFVKMTFSENKKKCFEILLKYTLCPIFKKVGKQLHPGGVRTHRHTQRHTDGKLTPPVRRSDYCKGKKRRKTKGKGGGREILILLPRASPWIMSSSVIMKNVFTIYVHQ